MSKQDLAKEKISSQANFGKSGFLPKYPLTIGHIFQNILNCLQKVKENASEKLVGTL